jgi:hypothetical protein
VEGGSRRWCKFNDSISTREGMHQNEALSKSGGDKLILLHGKEARNDTTAWRRRLEQRRHRGGDREETTDASWIAANLIRL